MFQFTLSTLRNRYRNIHFKFIYDGKTDKFILLHDSKFPNEMFYSAIKDNFPVDKLHMFEVKYKELELEDNRIWYLIDFSKKPTVVSVSISYG